MDAESLESCRAELDSCRARERWPSDWALAVVALAIGVAIGAAAVLMLPERWKCTLRCR